MGIRPERHLTGADISDSTCKKFTKYILVAGACLKAGFKCGIGAYAYMSTLADASNNIALLQTLCLLIAVRGAASRRSSMN